MKNILCFGDSNTWGYNPVTHDRYDLKDRWTGIVQTRLGNEYRIIEEGLNGRTTVWPDPIEGYKSGREYLIPCIETHKPLDLVIIMLGTNDLKKRFSLSAYDIAAGVSSLVDEAGKSRCGINGSAPQVLLISPIIVGDLTDSWLSDMFGGENASAVSRQFSSHYSRIAESYGCHFLDAALFAEPSPSDGIHLDREGHQKIGEAIAGKIKSIC